jgi:hypothetical protein
MTDTTSDGKCCGHLWYIEQHVGYHDTSGTGITYPSVVSELKSIFRWVRVDQSAKCFANYCLSYSGLYMIRQPWCRWNETLHEILYLFVLCVDILHIYWTATIIGMLTCLIIKGKISNSHSIFYVIHYDMPVPLVSWYPSCCSCWTSDDKSYLITNQERGKEDMTVTTTNWACRGHLRIDRNYQDVHIIA